MYYIVTRIIHEMWVLLRLHAQRLHLKSMSSFKQSLKNKGHGLYDNTHSCNIDYGNAYSSITVYHIHRGNKISNKEMGN